MDLINPIVPIDIRSSTPTPVLSNFFAIYTTSRKLCSTNMDRASVGVLSYVLIHLGSGNFRKVGLSTYVLAALFLLKFLL